MSFQAERQTLDIGLRWDRHTFHEAFVEFFWWALNVTREMKGQRHKKFLIVEENAFQSVP
jgi:hypothetical protein